MQNSRLRKQTTYWAISTAAVLVTAFVLVQPLQSTLAEVTIEEIVLKNCVYNDSKDPQAPPSHRQPDDPLSMNTVVINGNNANGGGVAKTVHAEKQIFRCNTTQGNQPVIVDLTIVAEIYENMTLVGGLPQAPIRKQAEAITCIKDAIIVLVYGCTSKKIPIGNTPVANCEELSVSHPQEMNTVNRKKVVKTIIAQKEVFRCNFNDDPPGEHDNPPNDTILNDKKVDVVLFEEIWEDMTKLGPFNQLNPNLGDPVIKKEFESMTCVIKIDTANAETCMFTQHV